LGINRVKKGSGWEHLLEIARAEGLSRAYTWNPAFGCSNVDCEVRKRGKCWAMKMARRFGWDFTPRLIPERLSEPAKLLEPSVITPVSMGDLFCLEAEHVSKIMAAIQVAYWHTYALLTKLPQRAVGRSYPENVWFGVTVNSQADAWRLDVLRKIDAPRKYVMFEPLYGPIDYDLSWLNLVVVGPQSYPTVQPDPSWVKGVVDRAGGARVFFKSNLRVVS
jgi:protein gp37